MSSFWSPGQSLEHIEKLAILQAYQFYRSNKTVTAQALGISIRTLDVKLEKYDADERDAKRQQERRAEESRNRLIQAKGNPGGLNSLSRPETGLRLEPAREITTEFPLPLLERPQVQEMLSKQAPSSRSKKGS